MVIAPLVNLASDFISSLTGSSSSSASTSASANTTTAGSTQAANQTSPFAQVLSSLQQSDLPEYQNVTQQLGGYLHTGAQAATANGFTALSNQLTQLSTDFSNMATTGQLPNF